jgi:ceramide glucosyltransferase
LFITFTSPWLLAGALFAVHGGAGAYGRALTVSSALGIAARVGLHARASRERGEFWRDLALVPLRDALLAAQWFIAAFGSHVVWRGARMPVVAGIAEGSDGS